MSLAWVKICFVFPESTSGSVIDEHIRSLLELKPYAAASSIILDENIVDWLSEEEEKEEKDLKDDVKNTQDEGRVSIPNPERFEDLH